jgi:hypothetical protein
MTAVWMHIDKFNGVVKIRPDHPLAIAQREKDAAAKTEAPPEAVPEHVEAAEPKSSKPPAKKKRKRKASKG